MSVTTPDFENPEVQLLDSVYKNSNRFPDWCEINPENKIKEETIKTLKESWKLMLSGKAQGYSAYKRTLTENAFKRMSFAKFGSPPTPPATMGSMSSASIPGVVEVEKVEKKEVEKKDELDKKSLSEHAVLSDKSKHVTLSDWSDESVKVNTPRISTPKAVTPDIFFYETFIENLYTKDVGLKLKLVDIRTEVNTLMPLCKLLVDSTELANKKEGSEQYTKELCALIAEYNYRKINATDYDTIGTALLLTLKQCLGAHHSIEIERSWKLAYSQFLKLGLQYVECQKSIHIKRRSMPPLMSLFPEDKMRQLQATRSSMPSFHEENKKKTKKSKLCCWS